MLSKNKDKAQQKPLAAPGNRKYYLVLSLIVLISFVVYLPVLSNGFVNWDDGDYIQNNPMIHTINLRKLFSSYVCGNYHPFTMLIYSIEYYFFGLSERGYHAVNLLIHLLNVVLVFSAVLLLSEKKEVALIASLLFGIHPMHVESVAWASELKDLLYVFFFLLSYIFYLRYLKDRQRKLYYYCLLLFLFSLLSKAMAASLPMLLLLSDYFKGRKINRSILVEKAPFFALAFIFGVIAIFAQRSASAIHTDYLAFPQRMVFASYGFIIYLEKLILPVNLCPYYPYPLSNGTSLPVQYYASLLLIFALAACVWYSLRFTKKVFFGMGFFTITIFLVLQLLPVGGAFMADRYSYLPSIGIFYLAGEGIVFLWNKKGATRNVKLPVIMLLSAALVFYSLKTYSQCGIWKNGLSLWTDIISKYQTIPTAYNNVGYLLQDEKKYDEALLDFNKAIELKPDYAEAYNNKGTVLNDLKQYEESLNDYDKAIQLQPDFPLAYYNMANVLNGLERYNEALADYSKAIQFKPDFAEAYYNRGNVLTNLQKYKEALSDYEKAIQYKPDFAPAYTNRGTIFLKLEKYEEALNEFNHAIALQPDSAGTYYSRGTVLSTLKRDEEAFNDYKKAVELQPDFADALLSLGSAYKEKKDTADAIRNFNLAVKYKGNVPDVPFYMRLGDNYHDIKNVADVDKYYDKVLQLEPKNALTLNSYSYYLALRGEKLDKAKAMSKLANEIRPREPYFEDTYSWILYRDGKYSEAVKSFKKAMSDGGDTIGVVLEHYGDALYKTGDVVHALAYWNKAKARGGTTDMLDKKIAEKKLVE